MKTKILLILVLAILILMVGCTAEKELGVEKELGIEDEWRLSRTGEGQNWGTNVQFAFEPGDKCSMLVYNPPDSNTFAYKILVKDDTYENYGIFMVTLDEGRTIEDLEILKENMAPPSYVNMISFDVVDPGSATFSFGSLSIDTGDLYFLCSVQGGDVNKFIEILGPLTVK